MQMQREPEIKLLYVNLWCHYSPTLPLQSQKTARGVGWGWAGGGLTRVGGEMIKDQHVHIDSF